nr:putative capsid protein [Picobirnavirus sp.]
MLLKQLNLAQMQHVVLLDSLLLIHLINSRLGGNVVNYKSKRDKAQGKFDPKKRSNKSHNRSKIRTTEDKSGLPISNDPNWYFTNSIMAEQISSFSFNQFLGVPFTLGNNVPSEVKFGTIATVWLNPSAGWTTINAPNVAGINMNGTKTFSQLSARNSKTTSYAPQDVTCLILALGSVIEYVEWLRRAFGLAFTYNVRNRAYVKQVIECMGINFNDFISNLADYRNKLNTVINMINQVPFPSNITYFDKCRSLYQDVYLDSMVSMAQSYIANPWSLWTIDEQYDENGTGLTTTSIFSAVGGTTMGAHIDQLYSMIQALLTSTTLNYIYSDVLAYADKKSVTMLRLDMIASDYSVMPKYSENALLQLKNATVVGEPLPTNVQYADGLHVTGSNDVKSNAELNCIMYTPQFKYGNPVMGIDSILNFKSDTPDVTSRIEASRYTVRAEATLVEGQYFTSAITLPDHYVVKMMFFTTESTAPFTLNSSGQTLETATYALLSRFGDMPYIYRFNSGTFHSVYGDVDYFTTIDMQYLQAINDMCFMGMFELR